MFKRHPDTMNHLKPLINTRWARPLSSLRFIRVRVLPRDRELHGAEQPVHVWQDEKGKTESRGKKSGRYFCCTGGSSTTSASTSGNIFLIMRLKSCKIIFSVAPAQLQSKTVPEFELVLKHLIEYPLTSSSCRLSEVLIPCQLLVGCSQVPLLLRGQGGRARLHLRPQTFLLMRNPKNYDRSPIWRTLKERLINITALCFSLPSTHHLHDICLSCSWLRADRADTVNLFSIFQNTADGQKTCIFREQGFFFFFSKGGVKITNNSKQLACAFRMSSVAPAVVKLTQHGGDHFPVTAREREALQSFSVLSLEQLSD